MKKILFFAGGAVLIVLLALITYGYAFYRSFNPLIVFDPGFYFTPQLELILKAKGLQASVLETLTLPIVRPPVGSGAFNFNLPGEVEALIQSNGQPTNYAIGLSFSLIPSEGVSPVAPVTVGELSFEPITAPAGSFELVLPITEEQQEVSVILPPSVINQVNAFAQAAISVAEPINVLGAIDTAVTSVNNFFTAPIKQTAIDISNSISLVFQKYDFGDAPDSPAGNFPSLLASNGARHKGFPILLGDNAGDESDSNQIDKDDLNVGEDDGGILYATGPIGAVIYGVKLKIHNITLPENQEIVLNVLYDKNGSLSWESTNEHIVVDKVFHLKPGESAIYSVPNINTTGKLNWLRADVGRKKLGINWLGHGDLGEGETEDYFLPPPKTPVDWPPVHLIWLSKGPPTAGPGPGSAGGGGGPPPKGGGPGAGPGPGGGGSGGAGGGGSGGGTSAPTEPAPHNVFLSWFGIYPTPVVPTKPCDPNDPNAPDNCNPPEITEDIIDTCTGSSNDSDNCLPPKTPVSQPVPPGVTVGIVPAPGTPVINPPNKPLIPPITTHDPRLSDQIGIQAISLPVPVSEPTLFDRIKSFIGIETIPVVPTPVPTIHDTVVSRIDRIRGVRQNSGITGVTTPTTGGSSVSAPVPPAPAPAKSFFDKLRDFFAVQPEPLLVEPAYPPYVPKPAAPIQPAPVPGVIAPLPPSSLPHDTRISRFQNFRENATQVLNSAIQTVQDIRTNIYQDVVLILNPEIIPLTQQQIDARESLFTTTNVPADTTLFHVPYPISRQTPEVQVNIGTDKTVPLVMRRTAEQVVINKQRAAIQITPTTVTVSPVQGVIQNLRTSLDALNTAVQNFAEKRGLPIQPVLESQLIPGTQPLPDKVLVDGKLVSQSVAEIASRPNQCWLAAANDGTKIILNIEVNGTTPTGEVASADLVAEGYDDYNKVVFREKIGQRPISGTAQGNILISYYSQPTDVARISGRVLSIVPTPTFFGGSGIPAYKRVAVKLIGRNGTNCSDSNLPTRSASGAASIQNPAGGTGLTVLSITPAASCGAVTLLPATLPDGFETPPTAYNQTITASNAGGSTFTFAVTSGSLPDSLSLNANSGAITGTPTRVALFSFTITATPVGACSATTGSRAYTINVFGGVG